MKRVTRLSLVVCAALVLLSSGCTHKGTPSEADPVDFYFAYLSEFYNMPNPHKTAFDISGVNEFPASSSPGQGSVFMDWQPIFASYEIDLSNITGVTGANIQLGAFDDQTGPIVANLFSGPTTGMVNGLLTSGTLDVNKLLGTTWDDFRLKAQAGQAYLNVLTTAHPNGELRGQLAAGYELDLQFHNSIKEYFYMITAPKSNRQAVTAELDYYASPTIPNNLGIKHVTLIGTPTQANANGLFAQGTFGETDIQGATPDQFLNALKSGNIYGRIKTNAFPDGAARGQIHLK